MSMAGSCDVNVIYDVEKKQQRSKLASTSQNGANQRSKFWLSIASGTTKNVARQPKILMQLSDGQP